MKDFKLPTSIFNANPDILKEAQNSKISFIPVDEIFANEKNLYHVRNVDGYAQSIQETGIHEPLTVMKRPEGYVLLAGHSRLAALKQLISDGYRYSYCDQDITGKAPVIIRPEFNDQMDELKALIAANYQRVLTGEDKAELIETCLKILEQDKKNGQKVKGRTAHLIADMIPVPEFYIKEYLAKKYSESDSEPEDAEKSRDKKRQYDKLCKQMKRLSKSLTESDLQFSEIDTQTLRKLSDELKHVLDERLGDGNGI